MPIGGSFVSPGSRMYFASRLLVDVGIFFVRSFFLDELISRAAFAANVDESCLLAHVTSEAGSIIAKAGRIAH